MAGTGTAARIGVLKMAHWAHRDEASWKTFRFNQPYAKGLERLRTEVLAKTDFDPATLWQWGTMQAMALVGVLGAVERAFGPAGQQAAADAISTVGLDVGRQILKDVELPAEMSDAEFISFYLTVINRIAYASLEKPRIESDDKLSFDILWCPHQDHYRAFDCRVQRYFVHGMIEAAREFASGKGWEGRFDTTIPSGAHTCHFTVWRTPDGEATAWDRYSRSLEEKALRRHPK